MGINATRALTCKYNAQLSCGRVQTPTLAMIAKREEEIKADSSPDPIYGIQGRKPPAGPDAYLAGRKTVKSARSFDQEKDGGA